jgi:hypothetical protein
MTVGAVDELDSAAVCGLVAWAGDPKRERVPGAPRSEPHKGQGGPQAAARPAAARSGALEDVKNILTNGAVR